MKTNKLLSALLCSVLLAAPLAAKKDHKDHGKGKHSSKDSCKSEIRAGKVVTDKLVVKDDANFGDDVRIKGDLCLKGSIKPKKSLEKSIDLLFEAFVAVDEGFNQKGGLTPAEIAALGYFDEFSTIVAHGPPSPAVPCGRVDHTLQPGTTAAFGTIECSTLQANFEGALLQDCRNFPFVDIADAPKLFHNRPIVTAVITNELFNVYADATVIYQGVQVGLLRSIAQYRINCDEKGNVGIPSIVWIHFVQEFDDCHSCQSFCQSCKGPISK